MYNLAITGPTYTGAKVNDKLFNVNVLVEAHTGETPWGGNEGNDLGVISVEALAALEQFDVDFVRFPAGQDKAIFSKTGMIVDDDLPSFLRNFLESAQEHNLSVNLVVPVESLEAFGGPSQAEILDGLELLASIIARDFPSVVAGYELGNEYWGGRVPGDDTREAAYGEAAGLAAVAIQSGAAKFNIDPTIILQASGNLGGAFDNSLTDANVVIQNAFAAVDGAMETVDGVLKNFYWRDRDDGAFDNGSGTFAEDRGIDENLNGWGDANWDLWAGRELTTYVGEYNITNRVALTDEGVDLGVHGASMLLEHFTNMVEAEVDVAFLWPFLHATRNSLIHMHEDIETENVRGMEIVTNTTRGAMFDLLRQSIVGDELIDLDWDTESTVEVTAFQDLPEYLDAPTVTSYTQTVFFSSRSDEFETIEVDLSELVSGHSSVSGLSIFYEDENDNHRDAILTELTDLDANLDGQFTLDLDAYEVVQVTFHYGHEMALDGHISFTQDSTVHQGANSDETLLLNDGDDHVHGAGGADWIDGGNGSDVLYGDEGNDTLIGGGFGDSIFCGTGDDLAYGNWGRDVIFGGEGNDTVYSGTMNDTVYGEAGHDLVLAASGNDEISGGSGNDTLYGSDGEDKIWGGTHNDVLDGGSGYDTISGGNGNDDIKGGSGEDKLFGGRGSDRLFGQKGNDSLIGNDGDDVLRAGKGNDLLTAGAGNDYLFGGAGFDELNGGTGDDYLEGNFNADVFSFNFDHGHDIIADFDAKNDFEVINFSNLSHFNSFADVVDNMVQYEAGVHITTSYESSIFLSGVDADHLDAADFSF